MEQIGEKSKEIYGYQTYYREAGYYINRLEHYNRALKYFDYAVEKTPTDKRAVRGRAWARSKTAKYKEALNDINKIIELYPDDLLLKAYRSLFTFLTCEFEDALIQNHRHMLLRKKPEHFYEGALQCREAIENCLGNRAGNPLRDHFLIVRKIQWRRNYHEQHPDEKYRRKKKTKKHFISVDPKIKHPKIQIQNDRRLSLFPGQIKHSDEVMENVIKEENEEENEDEDEDEDLESLRDTIYSIPSEENLEPPKIDYPYEPLQKRTRNIDNYMASKYLEMLYTDKEYLKNFNNLHGVRVPNKKGTQKILDLVKSTYKTVCFKQELLRTRRPFYYIKYQEVVSSGSLKRRQEEELRKIQRANSEEANKIIVQLKTATKERKYRTVLRLAEQLKEFCDARPKSVLPERNVYLTHIYKSVCQAHFDLFRFSKNQTSEQKDVRIKMLLKFEISREPSQDSLLQYFKDVFIDYRKLIATFTQRLKRAKNPEEAAWLYHELGRFTIEIKQTDVARVYCRKCIQEGYKVGNLKWVINALFIIIKADIMQSKPNDAKREALEAIKVSKNMQDEQLQEFFLRVKDIIDKSTFGAGLNVKALEKREKDILRMMDGQMKEEAAHLFRKMQALPASRRMSIMPGIVIQDDPEDKLKKCRSANASIMKATSNYQMDKSKTKPKVKLGFSDMIEFHIDTK